MSFLRHRENLGVLAVMRRGDDLTPLRPTCQRPFCRCIVRCAIATLVAQFFGCISSVLPMTVSAISLCEWP